MSLSNYEEVRPWARAIKQRTGIGPHAGVMPPWCMEKNIGIQKFGRSVVERVEVKVAKWPTTAPEGILRHAAARATTTPSGTSARRI
jgi:hypothetical protein